MLKNCFWLLFIIVLVSEVEAQDAERIYLTGTDNIHTKTWGFYCTNGRNSQTWTTIEVPSCWEQQGFGTYDYGRDYRTYGKNFKFADEKGTYRYSFDLPQSIKNKVVYLVFEGVMTDATAKINGQLAGETHQGAFYQFRYDVTNKLVRGQNELEVEVSKMSANKSVNHAERFADYWIFGGIFRPVYLEVVPKSHLERGAIAADASGNFMIDVFTKNTTEKQHLELNIYDPLGKLVVSTTQTIKDKTQLRTTVHKPKLWTSETPNLYRAEVLLKNGKKVIHRLSNVFGFRTIEVKKGDGIYVNGVKVKLKGVNRHAFYPETGRTLSREIDRQDVELIKAMNMNAVRCSHYPPDQSFLELCDSLGLYVLDELAGWQNAYDSIVGAKLVKEMVIRDVNHPSIIFWSNGNEGGTNKGLDDDFLMYDPSQRPVIHAHHKPGNNYNGIETNHYEKYYSTKNILEDSTHLIYMPTEFLHAQDDGGGAAGLSDFWELMWQSPRSGGGFLWAFVDEGVVRTDLNGFIDVNRVDAPDGLVGPHREKEGSFFAIKSIFSPVVFHTKDINKDFNGELIIENRFHFTNLEKCTFQGKLINFKSPTGSSKPKLPITFKCESPSVEPTQEGVLKLDLPNDWQTYDAIEITATDSFGNEIMTWSWKIQVAHKWQLFLEQEKKTNLNDDVIASETDSTISLSANDIQVHINKWNGQLLKVDYKRGLNPQFNNGPVVENCIMSPKQTRHFSENHKYIVETHFDNQLKYIRWTMYPSGLLQLDYEYDLQGEFPFLGVSFDYPESNIIGVEWLGNGPYRVWKNRMQGGEISTWKTMYNNTHTGSSPWIYPEFKGYYSDVEWMIFNTVEGKFLVGSDSGFFVRLFDFYGLSGPVSHPVLPQGDISFLDAIPPIGTKLATGLDTKTEGLGPQSELNKVDRAITRRLYFRFGM